MWTYCASHAAHNNFHAWDQNQLASFVSSFICIRFWFFSFVCFKTVFSIYSWENAYQIDGAKSTQFCYVKEGNVGRSSDGNTRWKATLMAWKSLKFALCRSKWTYSTNLPKTHKRMHAKMNIPSSDHIDCIIQLLLILMLDSIRNANSSMKCINDCKSFVKWMDGWWISLVLTRFIFIPHHLKVAIQSFSIIT